MSEFKPMLAVEADLERLRFPVLASAKLDGVRAIVLNGTVYSRNLKPIPNKHVQRLFREYDGLDGELIVGMPNAKDVYRQTVSGVMSEDGQPDVKLYAFDTVTNRHWPYHRRQPQRDRENVINLPNHVANNMDELIKLETTLLEAGYEGLILRDPNAPYKCGRSTVKEGYLLKLKRFMDAEAVVIGFEERMHNGNEAVVNVLGRRERSSHKDNKTGRGDLGAIRVKFGDIEFSIGTGFDDNSRRDIWNNRSAYLGALVKFKYFPVGVKDAPRFPVFLGWRAEIDK